MAARCSAIPSLVERARCWHSAQVSLVHTVYCLERSCDAGTDARCTSGGEATVRSRAQGQVHESDGRLQRPSRLDSSERAVAGCSDGMFAMPQTCFKKKSTEAQLKCEELHSKMNSGQRF